MPIYMFIADMLGESIAPNFKNWFDIYSFSWGESHPPGGALGLNDLTVAKPSGRSTPSLMLACANGLLLPAVQVVVTMTDHDRVVTFQRYTLTDTLISSFNVGGDGGGGRPTESLSLNFRKLKLEEFVTRADGAHSTELGEVQQNATG